MAEDNSINARLASLEEENKRLLAEYSGLSRKYQTAKDTIERIYSGVGRSGESS